MTRERYQAMLDWFRARPAAEKLLKAVSKGFTALVYAVYILLELWLLVHWDQRLLRCTLVPALVFLCGSALRRAINAPRPYEVYGLPSLTPKDTKGQSFPSRHVFCGSVIAVACVWVSPPLGILMCCTALIIAVSRVLTGVHFPKDVLAGLIFGFSAGFIGFYLV